MALGWAPTLRLLAGPTQHFADAFLKAWLCVAAGDLRRKRTVSM